jgi:hypothetical protein
MEGERRAEGRVYWGHRPDEQAAFAREHAAEHGWTLELWPDTPVVIDEHHSDRGIAAGTWGQIETLLERWAGIGCAWVNMRFGIEGGAAIVRVEANPFGEPLPDGGLPACNGGLDCHTILGHEEFSRQHGRRAGLADGLGGRPVQPRGSRGPSARDVVLRD